MNLRPGSTSDGPEDVSLWTVQKGVDRVQARLRLLSGRVEIRLLIGGRFMFSHRFQTGAEALAWADSDREDRLRRGWILVEPTQPPQE